MSGILPIGDGTLGKVQLTRLVARGWWVFMLRGAVSILFGILAFIMPGAALAVMIGLLAAWMVIDGVATIYHLVRGGMPAGEKSRGWMWVDGIVSLLAAAALLFVPGISALGLVLVTGAWFVIGGIARLVLAFRLGNVLLGLLGAVGVLVGAWMVLRPGPGLLALIWLVGFEAIAIGVLMFGIGFRLRKIHNDPHHHDPVPTPAG